MKFFNIKSIKNFLLDLLFPRFCISCGKEGEYVCEDCLSLIGISEYQFCAVCGKRVVDGKTCLNCQRKTKLNGLFSAASYNDLLVKKIITRYKYEPYIKELSNTLFSLIIIHFSLLGNYAFDILKDGILIPVPLHKKRQKERGFNQAEEIAKQLSRALKIPLNNNVLLKTKETIPQIELSKQEREKNLKNVFVCKNSEQIKNKKILLIDDVFTTGSTMEECAEVLKQACARQVWGIVAAREN